MHPVAAAGPDRAAGAGRAWIALRILLALLAALALVGCGGPLGPSPSAPNEVSDVIAALVVRGTTVAHVTSGDAGCPGSSLHSNGVHLQLTLPGETNSDDVYLVRWKSSDAFTAATADFQACLAEYQSAHPDATINQLARDPWRVYGPGWSPALLSALDAALQAAAGGG
jgi:hypothetical protein